MVHSLLILAKILLIFVKNKIDDGWLAQGEDPKNTQ